MIFYHITVDSAHFTTLPTSYHEHIMHGCSSTFWVHWPGTCAGDLALALRPKETVLLQGGARLCKLVGSGERWTENKKDLPSDPSGCPCQSVTALASKCCMGLYGVSKVLICVKTCLAWTGLNLYQAVSNTVGKWVLILWVGCHVENHKPVVGISTITDIHKPISTFPLPPCHDLGICPLDSWWHRQALQGSVMAMLEDGNYFWMPSGDSIRRVSGFWRNRRCRRMS